MSKLSVPKSNIEDIAEGIQMENKKTVSCLDTMGKRLEALRTDRGVTQSMLAEAADCSVATVNRIERDRGGDGVSTAFMRAFCDLLNCSIDWMITGHGPDPFTHGAPLDGIIGKARPAEFERLRVAGLDSERNLRYVLLTSDTLNYYRAGDVMVVDCNERPTRGEEFAAMVDGEVRLMRLASDVGSSTFAELHDGTRQIFEPEKAAWFGSICGTLSSKRLRVA